jgi:hypothetical protein
MGLYEAFERFYAAPEKLKKLAELGCKVVLAPIVRDDADTRVITIQLGDNENSYDKIWFIERSIENSLKTEVYTKDGSGKEKKSSYQTLEEVKDFYKKDLAENKEGIYEKYVSRTQFVASTLGVALDHLGSAHFDNEDLQNFAKFGLGCKVVTAPIDQVGRNTRVITIQLGDNENPHDKICFIERRKADDIEETEVYTKYANGTEELSPFKTLKAVKDFCKKDLAENKEGIYEKFVSPTQFVASTLGVALDHLGSDDFDNYDLQNLVKSELVCKIVMAPIDQDGLETRVINIPLRDNENSHDKICFIERRKSDDSAQTEVYAKYASGTEKLSVFKTLEAVKEFFKKGLAENKDGIYEKYVSRAQFVASTLGVALGHLGSDDFDNYDLKNFAKFFNLNVDILDVEACKGLAKLKSPEIAFLIKMRTSPVHADGWNPDNTHHLLSMINFGLYNGVSAVYDLIFSKETMRNCVAITGKILELSVQLDAGNDTPAYTEKFFVEETNKVNLTYFMSGKDEANYVALSINGIEEKISGINIYALQQSIGKKLKATSENIISIDPQFLKTTFDNMVNVELQRTLVVYSQPDTERTNTHREQINLDWVRAKEGSVLIQPHENQRPFRYPDLFEESNLGVTDQGRIAFPDTTRKNIALLQLEQNYALFGTAITRAGAAFTTGEPTNWEMQKKYTRRITVIPADFAQTMELWVTGTAVFGQKLINWEGKFKVTDAFYDTLDKDDVIDTKAHGIDIATVKLTKAEWSTFEEEDYRRMQETSRHEMACQIICQKIEPDYLKGEEILTVVLNSGERIIYTGKASGQLFVRMNDGKEFEHPTLIRNIKDLKAFCIEDMSKNVELYKQSSRQSPELKPLFRQAKLHPELSKQVGIEFNNNLLKKIEKAYELQPEDLDAALACVTGSSTQNTINGLQFLELARLHNTVSKVGSADFDEPALKHIMDVYNLEDNEYSQHFETFKLTHHLAHLNEDVLLKFHELRGKRPIPADEYKIFLEHHGLDALTKNDLFLLESIGHDKLQHISATIFQQYPALKVGEKQILLAIEREKFNPQNRSNNDDIAQNIVDSEKVNNNVREMVHSFYRPGDKGNKPQWYKQPEILEEEKNQRLLAGLNSKSFDPGTLFCVLGYSRSGDIMLINPLVKLALTHRYKRYDNEEIQRMNARDSNHTNVIVGKEYSDHYINNQNAIDLLCSEVLAENGTLHVKTERADRNSLV